MFSKIPYWARNKYFLTFLFFVIWLTLFDRNDLLTRYKYQKTLNELEIDRDFYLKEIESTRAELYELTTNPRTLEKFAREKYFMKKNNEEIFIFTTE